MIQLGMKGIERIKCFLFYLKKKIELDGNKITKHN